MQISEHLYVDLEIESLDKRDFLGAQDLVDLQIIETAGSSLPIIYMAFIAHDHKIANYFIENNKIRVIVGETKENADTFTVDINKANNPANDNTGSTWAVEFAGFVNSRDYMVNYETTTYRGNSQMVSYQVLNKTLGIKPGNGYYSDILTTNENQVVWRRNNQSACTFVAETLVHMDIMPSFPLFAFDRHGTFYLRNFEKLIKTDPVVSFVTKAPTKTNEIQYVNNFTVDNFKDMYNLYSGFNKVTEIYGAKTGMSDFTISANEPILAATKESAKAQSTTRSKLNLIQSANVHNTYVSAFVYNTNKLVALSSMSGVLQVFGYYKNFKPTDLVSVYTGGEDTVLDGLYLIDTIRTQADMKSGTWHTYVYVTRDNKNFVENYLANPRKGLKISKKFWADLANAVSRLKVAYATGLRIIDGTYMKRVLSFAIETKTNLLRSFSVAGVTIDFTSSANLLKSLINTGNALMNTLTSMIFPEQVANIFRDFIIRKPTLKALLINYVDQYVPYELRDVVVAIIDALFTTTNSLNSIAKDNNISVAKDTLGEDKTNNTTVLEGDETVIDTTDTSEIDYISESQKKVNNIITTFENNTTGLNIPFPIIELTESQSLMPEQQLREYVASETIANLTNLGYLDGVDKDKFNDILLGNEPIDFNIIDQINKNAGNSYNYRIWGTFGSSSVTYYAWERPDLTEDVVYTTEVYLTTQSKLYNGDGSEYIKGEYKIVNIENTYTVVYETIENKAERNDSKNVISNNLTELTSFYIKKNFKDKYRTIPCTKLINAIDNAKIFFACPTREENLKFYINSKRVELPSFEISLGYTDAYGNQIPYTVYYTEVGYNSNSVLFEVKQGGMV